MLRKSLGGAKDVLHLINHGSREVLLDLPGLGPRKVDKILSLRQACLEEGRKIRVNDVVSEKNGVGPALLAKLAGEGDAATVIKYSAFYQQYFYSSDPHSQFQQPSSVLSLDLGIHNSAYVLLDHNFKVCDWKKVELGMPSPYSPGNCFVEVEKSLQLLPNASLVVLEEQSHRNPANQGFLNISVELRTLEAMVFAITRLTRQVPVYSLLAARVSRYFCINNKKRATKKKLAVDLVRRFLNAYEPLETPLGNRLDVSSELIEYFEGQSKKDDLSDCMLQALAVMDWSQMAQQL